MTTRTCEWCGKEFDAIFRRNRMQRFCGRRCAASGRAKTFKDTPTYEACHIRVYTAKGSASDYQCLGCGKRAQQWSFNHSWLGHADPKGRRYSTDVSDYDPMCIRCHRKRDIQQCLNGHPLTGANLYVAPGTGHRSCRECSRSRRAVAKAGASA